MLLRRVTNGIVVDAARIAFARMTQPEQMADFVQVGTLR